MQADKIGRYTLVKRLASGPVADVHLALMQSFPGFDKPCALKVVHREVSELPDFADHLRREAALVLSLAHPNVVAVNEIGCDEGRWFIAMELVEGCDLGLFGKRCWHTRHAPALLASLYIVHEALRGLAYCHRQVATTTTLGEVHRELCGSNVLVSFEGTVKIGDFGLSLSPDRLRRSPDDPRDDLFCIGALLYDLVTGERFDSRRDPVEVLARLAVTSLPGLPPITPGVRELMCRALALDPRARFQSAPAFRQAIQRQIIDIDPTFGSLQLAALMEQLFAPVGEPRSLARSPDGDLSSGPATDRSGATGAGDPSREPFGGDLADLETLLEPSALQPEICRDASRPPRPPIGSRSAPAPRPAAPRSTPPAASASRVSAAGIPAPRAAAPKSLPSSAPSRASAADPPTLGASNCLDEQQVALPRSPYAGQARLGDELLEGRVTTEILEISTDELEIVEPAGTREPARAGGARVVATSAFVIGPDGKLRRIRLVHGESN